MMMIYSNGKYSNPINPMTISEILNEMSSANARSDHMFFIYVNCVYPAYIFMIHEYVHFEAFSPSNAFKFRA